MPPFGKPYPRHRLFTVTGLAAIAACVAAALGLAPLERPPRVLVEDHAAFDRRLDLHGLSRRKQGLAYGAAQTIVVRETVPARLGRDALLAEELGHLVRAAAGEVDWRRDDERTWTVRRDCGHG